MWWLRRIDTVHVPNCRARGMARSMARVTSQVPGRRSPSQVSAAGKSATTLGSPRVFSVPLRMSAR